MKYMRLSIIFLVLALCACDMDKDKPSIVNGELNLQFVNGDYTPTDANGQLIASQSFQTFYITVPPNPVPETIIDTNVSIYAKFKVNNVDRIYAGVLMHNNDTIPFNPFFGYMNSSFATNKDVFKTGSVWNYDGNSQYNISGENYNTSLSIPTLELDTLMERYKKSEGISIQIKSANLNCDKFALCIIAQDTVRFQKELDPFNKTIYINPEELAGLKANQDYRLIIRVKNYTISVSNNKKYYYQNEIVKIHDFELM
jgi:hypothetical protein